MLYLGSGDTTLPEYHRLPSVDQDPVLDVPAYGAREDHTLHVAAFAHHVFERVSVGDAGDVLLDDRPFVQHLGHVMAGGADQLHPALERAMIWLRSDERRQERVMDVDDPVRVPADEL